MFIHGKKIFLDTENSITIYQKLIKKFNDVSILESVIGGENKGRYSIILFNIYDNIEIHQNHIVSNLKKKKITSPNLYLKSLQKNNNFTDLYNKKIPIPFTIGNISFDFAKFSLPKLKYDMTKSEINIPLAHFVKPKNLIIIDNILNETHLIEFSINKNKNKTKLSKIEDLLLSTPKQNKKNLFIKPSSFKKHMSKNIFFEKVNNLKKEIINGEIFQAVLSQRFSAKYEIDPFKFYRALRSINPSPYLVFLNLKKYQIICSSPETMINVKNKKVTLRPIAGTRKRGKNHNEDIQLRNDLLNDTKELAEHLMLVDLGRNDVGQISKKGTVNVTEKNIIEYYSHVMHIVSNVTGELRNNLTPIDVLYAGLPAGTVSGAPKIRALELLEELEEVNREFYSGSVCYLDINGDMDSCINLRTAMIKDNTIYTQSGAGIVYDSIDKNEYLECINKANAIFEAYKIAHQIK
jgi:anthranilate synthase component 1